MPDDLVVPMIACADARLSRDSREMFVELSLSDGEKARMRVGIRDVELLVALLLRVASEGGPGPDSASVPHVPVPASALGVTASEECSTGLLIGVGPVSVLFDLPERALDEIGRGLLMASRRADRRSMM